MNRHTSALLVISLCSGLLAAATVHPTLAQSREQKHFESEVFEWEDAVVRLDNFFVELGSSPNYDWHVIVYGGQNRKQGEAEAWVACVEDHVFKGRSFVFGHYGISRDQVKVVGGGYRENVTLEFWLIPRGERAPSAKPTIEPQDVKFSGRVKKWRSLCKS
jgi:hypothetical protein